MQATEHAEVLQPRARWSSSIGTVDDGEAEHEYAYEHAHRWHIPSRCSDDRGLT